MYQSDFRYALFVVCIFALACGEKDGSTVETISSKEVEISPQLPPDVDTELQSKLDEEGDYAKVQRLFDVLSWQSFIALNWPVAESGDPLSRLSNEGTFYWESYSETYQVFKPDGSEPDPYGQARQSLPDIDPDELPNVGDSKLADRNYPELLDEESYFGFTVLDEVNQAFSTPLWDQYGNLVHYQILVNQPEYDYLVENELYNLEGQVDYYEKNGDAEFPSGEYGTDDVGAVELKLAWRVLTDQDDPERYLVHNAYIVAGDPPEWQEVLVGMVGMHISHKTKSSPQWIWSTFEHVDNIQINAFRVFGTDSPGHPRVPSFNDPSCEYCATNVVPDEDEDGLRRTQVSRVVPVPLATQDLNGAVQARLAELDSVLRYYELINTQWPTDPSAPPAEDDEYPENITNKSGGKPTPTFLINSTMETYFQSGAAGSDVTLGVGGESSSIPSTNGGNTPLKFAEGMCLSVGVDCGDAGEHLVLSTESCMGCHSSASIAVSKTDDGFQDGDQLSGDFSWLLQMKAQSKSD